LRAIILAGGLGSRLSEETNVSEVKSIASDNGYYVKKD